MEGKELQIVTAAEKRIRSAGYHGFSFREIATDVGIKSSSVHHYFPTKELLGVAVARCYTERFFAGLAKTSDLPHLELRRAFLKAMDSDGLVCLCGALAAGADSLPARVVLEAKHFFEAGIAFLIGDSDGKHSARRAWAMKVLALLEGAMVLSLALGDPKCFARATQDLPDPPASTQPKITRRSNRV